MMNRRTLSRSALLGSALTLSAALAGCSDDSNFDVSQQIGRTRFCPRRRPFWCRT